MGTTTEGDNQNTDVITYNSSEESINLTAGVKPSLPSNETTHADLENETSNGSKNDTEIAHRQKEPGNKRIEKSKDKNSTSEKENHEKHENAMEKTTNKTVEMELNENQEKKQDDTGKQSENNDNGGETTKDSPKDDDKNNDDDKPK